jgi:hypothetical protein
MKVGITEGKEVDRRDLDVLESAVASPLDDAFREFVRLNDGGVPEPNVFMVADDIDASVSQFIPTKEIDAERRNIENLPNGSFPFAWAEGGNYLILDRDGQVFFWDHEEPDRRHLVANGFDRFLNLLEPPPVVTLQPGQVKEAWIDPDFLKRISKT